MEVVPAAPITFGVTAYGEYAKVDRIGPCTWPHFDLLVVHEGRLALVLEGNHEDLTPGDALLIFPETTFGGEIMAPPSRISVQHFGLRSASAAELPPVLGYFHAAVTGYRRAHLPEQLIQHDIARAMTLARQPVTAEVMCCRVAQLTLLVAAFLPCPEQILHSDRAQRLAPALALIRQRLRESVKLDELSACCGMSTSHFRAEFRAAFGQSPGVYLQQAKLNYAAQLLARSATPIKEIAWLAGYSHLRNFYRIFKRRFGITPVQYRSLYAPRFGNSNLS